MNAKIDDLLAITAWNGNEALPKHKLKWSRILGKEAALFLDADRMSKALVCDFASRAWDFMRIAAAIYAADRSIKRPAMRGNDSWVRRMHLEFPVEEPDFWNSRDTVNLMTNVLSFLTGDDWSFNFTLTQSNGRQRALQFTPRWTAKYYLYSGGLDSASCSHPLRAKIADQCGQCPACIFRRHSLWVAGIEDTGDRYKYQIFESNSSVMTSDASEAICHFLEMIERIGTSRSVGETDWIANHCKTTGMAAAQEVYGLFRRYRLEWLAFCKAAQKEKWPWGGYQMPCEYEG